MMYMIMLLDVMMTAKALNLAFAALCVWNRCGLCPKKFALLSALLYLALAFC
jgi:hypothetical protein